MYICGSAVKERRLLIAGFCRSNHKLHRYACQSVLEQDTEALIAGWFGGLSDVAVFCCWSNRTFTAHLKQTVVAEQVNYFQPGVLGLCPHCCCVIVNL